MFGAEVGYELVCLVHLVCLVKISKKRGNAENVGKMKDSEKHSI